MVAMNRGTHRIPDTPKQYALPDGTRAPGKMPNHVTFGGPACPAGTALLFDTRTWHCGMPNTSQDERRGIIINYGSFHFKQTGVVQESARVLNQRGCLLLKDPEVRQLLGLCAMNGTNRYDSNYVRTNPMPDVR